MQQTSQLFIQTRQATAFLYPKSRTFPCVHCTTFIFYVKTFLLLSVMITKTVPLSPFFWEGPFCILSVHGIMELKYYSPGIMGFAFFSSLFAFAFAFWGGLLGIGGRFFLLLNTLDLGNGEGAGKEKMHTRHAMHRCDVHTHAMRNLRDREGRGERDKIILYCDDEERKYHIMTIIPYHTIPYTSREK